VTEPVPVVAAPLPPTPVVAALPTRPVLKPALRRLWRGPASLQLGVTARHAVVLSGIGPDECRVLDLLDGSRTVEDVVRDTAERGTDEATARRLLGALAGAAALDDASLDLRPVDEARRQRLEPDRLALTLVRPEPGGAARAMQARHAAAVTVRGAARLGATVVGLLQAAGVGRVGCVDDGPVRAADLAPGGLRVLGATRRDSAVAETLRDCGSGRVTAGPARAAGLTVLATAGPAAPEVLHAVRRHPHLLVTVQETTATIGPFVLPGVTPCLRCLQLHRSDRDPAWPAVAAQLAGSRRDIEPCDVVLATAAASLAVAQTLAWIETAEAPPATAGGLLELEVDHPRLRRRSLRPHPACGCLPAD